jgi:hypothetical protein
MVSYPPSFYLKMARAGKIHIVFYAATAVVYLNESRGDARQESTSRRGVHRGGRGKKGLRVSSEEA